MAKGSDESSANEMKKEQTETCPGQAKCESCLSKGQAGIQVFYKLCLLS